MSCFVDTSALLALLDADDNNHDDAAAIWKSLVAEAGLVTSNYVLLETVALVQRRLGLKAVRALIMDLVPVLTVVWITSDLHQAAQAAMLSQARRRLSLVDCASFEIMRRQGILRCFAFDRHFKEQGFAAERFS